MASSLRRGGPSAADATDPDRFRLRGDYQQQEPLHQAVVAFFDQTAAQLITSPICIAEVLWLLLGDPRDPRVLAAQNHLLGAVSRGGIVALNERDSDLPGDCDDLTLVTLSERLDVAEILTLVRDFDVSRRIRREPSRRVPIG